MQHFSLDQYRILVAMTDVIAWNPKTDEMIFLKHKFKTWYRESAFLPLINFDRECGKSNHGVYYLSKEARIVQVCIEHGKLVERSLMNKVMSMAVFKRDEAVVLSEDTHLSLVHLPTKVVHYAAGLAPLGTFAYRTVSVAHDNCTVVVAEYTLKGIKATSVSKLFLFDSRLGLISSLEVSISSRMSRQRDLTRLLEDRVRLQSYNDN